MSSLQYGARELRLLSEKPYGGSEIFLYDTERDISVTSKAARTFYLSMCECWHT